MLISQLKQAKKDPDRVHIYSDDKYIGTVYIDYIVKYKIFENKEISELDLDAAITESNNKKLFNLCINFIARRMRSEKEIREYIIKKIFKYKWDPAKVRADEIIEKLIHYKYIDDHEFAIIWGNSRLTKGNGPVKIRMMLRQKGVENEIINEILQNLDPEEIEKQKTRITEKYLKNKKFKDDREKDWKVKQHLMSRGF